MIYILTNPSFKEYVKIGYAKDMTQRLAQLNRSECLPFAFHVYATYEVPCKLSDLKVHDIIDCLAPNLRAIETFNGKIKKREFYAMPPEQAFSILQAMAQIHDCEDKLKKWVLTDIEKQEILTAENNRRRLAPFCFSMCNIKPGEKVTFQREGNEHDGLEVDVLDDKHVLYNNKPWSLSALATEFIQSKWGLQGTLYFYYNNERLDQLRLKFEDDD